MKMQILKSEKGFSLIEALLSISMLGLTCIAYSFFSQVSTMHSTNALKTSVASNVVRTVAEDLNSMPAGSTWLLSQAELPLGTPYPFTRFFTADCKETSVAAQAYYTVLWTVTPDVPIVGARSIGMIVSWNEGSTPKTLGMRVVR